MTLFELTIDIEFCGGLLISVWDDDNDRYEIELADYDELSTDEIQALHDKRVSCIYPYINGEYAATVIELYL